MKWDGWELIQHQNHPEYLYWAELPAHGAEGLRGDDEVEIRHVTTTEDKEILGPERGVRSGTIPYAALIEYYQFAVAYA